MRCLPISAAISGALLLPPVACAQDVTEPALKAAFIYNFLKFTEWPEILPASEPFAICVLGDPGVGEALDRVVKDREFAGRRMTVSMTVSLMDLTGPKKPCRVIYISGVSASQRAELLARLQNSSVLTISDAADFTGAGGMAQFFFERGQLRFEIGLAAVKRSRLQMSSRLLALAKRHE